MNRWVVVPFLLALTACQPATTMPISLSPTPTQALPSATVPLTPTAISTTPPGSEHITGSIELDGGVCCTGGQTGVYIQIPATLYARSRASYLIRDMRLAYSYPSSESEVDIESAEWRSYTEKARFPVQLISGSLGFTACVQFKDALSLISEVYCEEISIKGVPGEKYTSLELGYDLLWLNRPMSNLMRFDHETQETNCLIGPQNDCQIIISGEVREFSLNGDKTQLLFDIHPPWQANDIEKLALLDLQTLDFRIFHELEESARLGDISLSPDGLWVAYRDVDDGQVYRNHIVSTVDSARHQYEFACINCISYLHWSYDSSFLGFGGIDELRIVENTGKEWVDSPHFVQDNAGYHSPHSWAPGANYLLTNEWSAYEMERVLFNYIFTPDQNTYLKLFWTRPGVHISSKNWLDESTLVAVQPLDQDNYSQESILNVTNISPDATSLVAKTEEYGLSFSDKGFAFLPHKLSDTEILFGRIAQKLEGTYWVEAYYFDTATQNLELINSCLFTKGEHAPILWDWAWTPGNDLIFSTTMRTLIIPTDGRTCLDLKLAFGSNFRDITWIP